MSNNKRDKTRIQTGRRQSQWRESLMATMQPSTENPKPTEINVGRQLQELRKQQSLSIRSLAEMSGLNFNTLSLIENEKTSPNVNTLQRLATALQVPITAFFESSFIRKEIVFQKKGDRPETTFPHGELEDLGGGMALGEATPLLMTLKPNSSSGLDGIVHTGQEFVYCLEGSIVYWVGGDEYFLEPGDSLIFQAHIPHRWENRGEILNRSILVICPSDNSDRSVEQHLMKDNPVE
ncbi:MAG: cupin domain-containing protein [Anaerolineaceae bacterium]|nr:cupin domain-containing protein [Anaerolineaceae bacterium]